MLPSRCAISFAAAPPISNLQRCARLRTLPQHSIEHRATIRAIRGTARRALALEAEAAEYETELEQLVVAICPVLLAQPGVGTITAASSSSPGHTLAGSALKRPSPLSPARRPSPPAAAP